MAICWEHLCDTESPIWSHVHRDEGSAASREFLTGWQLVKTVVKAGLWPVVGEILYPLRELILWALSPASHWLTEAPCAGLCIPTIRTQNNMVRNLCRQAQYYIKMTTQKRPSYNFFLLALYITSRAFAHQASTTDHEKVHKLTGQAGTRARFYSGTVGWTATIIWKYVLANQPQASPLRPWTDDYWRCHQKQLKILPPPHALSLHLSGPGTTVASHLPNALWGREGQFSHPVHPEGEARNKTGLGCSGCDHFCPLWCCPL